MYHEHVVLKLHYAMNITGVSDIKVSETFENIISGIIFLPNQLMKRKSITKCTVLTPSCRSGHIVPPTV